MPTICRSSLALAFCAFSACVAPAQWQAANPVQSVQKDARGITLKLQTGNMRLEVCSPSIIHVIYSATDSFGPPNKDVIAKTDWPSVEWRTSSSAKEVGLTTAQLNISITRDRGVISYTAAANGEKLLSEGPKMLTDHHSEDFFNVYGSQESIYGLGQHQAGVWNYRGESVDLSQENTNITIPMFLSSRGYGVFWNNPSVSKFNNRFASFLYMSSNVADTVDYYFFYGPEFDKIIADYRELTGAAPLFGKWAYGFWQSKNRYRSQKEILDLARKYRQEHIPIDNIVQDWFWWTKTGEFVFNSNYPDPKQMMDELHNEHFHLMVSIWPFFYPGTANYDLFSKNGWFLARTKVAAFHPLGTALYNAFDPAARAEYWRLVNKGLFSIGADAWWMDTTEPETEGQSRNILLPEHARDANLFPVMTTRGIYQSQRHTSEDKRVFILSRSAFAGSQRDGVAAWSGDVLSDFITYKRQIPAGLNFALSGVPYWTTDIGGFILGHPNDPAYRELFIRWFQYGSFCPIFRVHGTRAPDTNELWSYGPEAQAILTKFDNLRYRLMPYIYSLAWKITSDSYTPMRPLVMDFRNDDNVLDIGDQFMYGPAFLVNPVTEKGAATRHLYLPKSGWYDFWTGQPVEGGRYIDAPAPLESMPLYVRAGSIVPMGPELQYAEEKPADPIEMRVYPGADGDFLLYEDQNDTYNYEHGVYATIPLHWNDAQKTLRIGQRTGSFPGMLQSRTFNVVFVGGAGRTVQYTGQAVDVKAQ